MNWLAFDTSTDTLSVAVARAGRLWLHDSPGGAHASTDGLPTVLRLMQEAQLHWPDLTAIVMGRGPGAFTGLRTACSMAQGLAWGAGLKVLPIDTLLAVAETAWYAHPEQAGRERVLVVMDARMSQVYVGAYEKKSADTWHCVAPPALCSPHEVRAPDAWLGHVYGIAGNAHAVYAAQWPNALSTVPVWHALPSAQALVRLAAQAWAQGQAVAPEDALPLYVRDKVAQTTEERWAERQTAGQHTVRQQTAVHQTAVHQTEAKQQGSR